ncbi:cytochrome P450 [Gonapodya prolifera JEL478]|uniref:Cytochrome P450 n=1 Tax=Gonapodya prolifera (strain JEL478) TaxID=1344416 RepID=A0A139A0K9_GONPJ|nr:cytochrome P450 [Gonapodya prolifera JEL478]|eukprot:KXS10317.1 cytochrome P450 [Gonapodya prolifera JEL478]
MILYAALAFCAFVAFLYYKYPDRAVGTRPRPDVPNADDTVPIFGGTFSISSNVQTLHEWVLNQAKKHGDVWRTTILAYPPVDMILTTNVTDVEHILRDPWTYEKGVDQKRQNSDLFGHGIFAADGDEWKVQRKVASNIFNVKNFRDFYSPIFHHDATQVVRHLEQASKIGAFIDIHDLLLRSTLDSFLKISMGEDRGCLASDGTVVDGRYTLPPVEFAIAFDTLNSICAKRGSIPFWQVIEKLNGTDAKRDWCQKVLHGNAQKIIDKKRQAYAAGQVPKDKSKQDLLDYFMQTENDDGTPVTDEQLRDVVINFIVAGRDTTAQTLSWVFYELSKNPQILAKVRQECLSVLGPTRMCDYNDLKELKYTTATFNEVLRLYANVPFNFKVPTKDDVLPGSKTKVYKGQRVAFHPYAMGRLTKIWGPDAEEMRPERWIDESGNLSKENSFKWPVFNAGPRICLGMNMATQEAVVLMSSIVRRFNLELCNEANFQNSNGRLLCIALQMIRRNGACSTRIREKGWLDMIFK